MPGERTDCRINRLGVSKKILYPEGRVETEIYYFTGTGNSLVVAREFAEKLGASLVSIPSARDVSVIATDAELIGIVFPNYYGDIPLLVGRFAERLRAREGSRIFAVCTYGGGPGKAFRSLEKILEAGGLSLWGKYGIHLPQNAFRKSWERFPKIYASASKQIEKIARFLETRKRRHRFKDRLLEALLLPLAGLVEPATRKWLGSCSGSSPDLPMADLIHRSDRLFGVNEECNGCGICVEVCPADNIRLEKGKPVWLGRCENCIACYNWCPRRAITGGISQKGYFYRHPEVTVSDMMAQKNGAPERG